VDIASLLVLLGFLAVPVPADTSVSGTITTTTWTKANSPYRVTATITVPSGNTLTIQPGVDVLVDSAVSIIVGGSLVATGTPTDSVRFVGANTNWWGGIRVSGGDSSSFSYARISGAFGSDRYGGIVVADSGTKALFLNCVISGNATSEDGGGISSLGASLMMRGCRVSHNIISAGVGYGVGIYLRAGNACIVSCEMTGNDGPWGGGLAFEQPHSVASGAVFIDSSTFTGNHVQFGGGLYIHPVIYLIYYLCIGEEPPPPEPPPFTVTVSHTLIADNWALHSASALIVENPQSTVNLTNCTIVGNTGGDWHPAAILISGPATVNAVNSIVWGNSPSQLLADYDGHYAISYSAVEGDTLVSGEGNINADPLFADPATGDYHLKWGSPCIDAGDPNSPLDPGGTRADMGAFYHPHGVSVADVDRPVSSHLAQNFPNPFNANTIIRFSLPEAGQISLMVYDVNGRVVRKLVNEYLLAGVHGVLWDGNDLTGRQMASGVYLYRLVTPSRMITRRMTLVR
jgi:hypothetical protein